MPKLIWGKKLQEAVKRQQRFGWSVREKRGKVLVQRYYPDTNTKNYCCFTNSMGTKSRIICIKCPAKYKRLHAKFWV